MFGDSILSNFFVSLAQYWYDMLDLPEKVEQFDYGLKLAIEHMNDDVINSK